MSGSEGQLKRGFAWLSSGAPRGLALFLGGFVLVNLAGNLRAAGFDANLWWLDLRPLPAVLQTGMLLVEAICLLAFGVKPPGLGWRRLVTLSLVGALAGVTLVNTFQFYLLLARGEFRTGMPLPLSLLLTAGLTLIMVAVWRTRWPMPGLGGLAPALVGCLGCLLAFPVFQMFCFGKTDYRRPADIAVVLGARVYADGHPSDALADRVRTACQLYRDGLVRKLLFSGGPGDGAIDEPEAMRLMALRLGVKPEDILLDPAGFNTQATVNNAIARFKQMHASRVLVVSHFYHLPRIKLAFHRQQWEVYTVPAKESYVLRQLPYNMAREVAALWVYYLRPLSGHSA